MYWKVFLKLVFIFLFCNCIYVENHRLNKINYPETAYYSGFVSGSSAANEEYFHDWCKKFCEEIKTITLHLSDKHYLEIRGKMDATELAIDRERLSLGRADSIKQLLIRNGFPSDKMKAIADPKPEEHLGRDKFAPENRTVRFLIQKMD